MDAGINHDTGLTEYEGLEEAVASLSEDESALLGVVALRVARRASERELGTQEGAEILVSLRDDVEFDGEVFTREESYRSLMSLSRKAVRVKASEGHFAVFPLLQIAADFRDDQGVTRAAFVRSPFIELAVLEEGDDGIAGIIEEMDA